MRGKNWRNIQLHCNNFFFKARFILKSVSSFPQNYHLPSSAPGTAFPSALSLLSLCTTQWGIGSQLAHRQPYQSKTANICSNEKQMVHNACYMRNTYTKQVVQLKWNAIDAKPVYIYVHHLPLSMHIHILKGVSFCTLSFYFRYCNYFSVLVCSLLQVSCLDTAERFRVCSLNLQLLPYFP